MPSIGFVLPHWLYWAGLLIFPLVAMALVRREKARRPDSGPSLPVAYLFLVCGGFAGLHRFYLRNVGGLLFIPILLFIVYGNAQERAIREDVSAARADAQSYERLVNRAEDAVARKRSGAQERLDKARADYAEVKAKYDAVLVRQGDLHRNTRIAALVLLAALIVDAVLLPRLVRRARIEEESEAEVHPHPAVHDIPPEDPPSRVGNRPLALWIDGLNHWVGQFVAYWTVIAVFVYYYEVVVRFLFNSPTNWAHESMFLMFGMQYLLCGAYALRTDSHVRVDVLYVKMGPRGRAVADLLTSFFFFVFTITLLLTGWRFAQDAVSVGEVSFTEWGIQYWLVKLSIPIGAVLLLLQGIAHMLRDLDIVFRGEVPRPDPAHTVDGHSGVGSV